MCSIVLRVSKASCVAVPKAAGKDGAFSLTFQV